MNYFVTPHAVHPKHRHKQYIAKDCPSWSILDRIECSSSINFRCYCYFEMFVPLYSDDSSSHPFDGVYTWVITLALSSVSSVNYLSGFSWPCCINKQCPAATPKIDLGFTTIRQSIIISRTAESTFTINLSWSGPHVLKLDYAKTCLHTCLSHFQILTKTPFMKWIWRCRRQNGSILFVSKVLKLTDLGSLSSIL